MTTHYLKQCRPDAKETAYFWKLYHAAQRVEDRWCRNTVPEIAEALSYCSELSREQKLFLLRAWQVLVDDKGGFGRFMGAFDTYVHNVQDPADDCVAYKPELKRHIEKGYLFDTVLEGYEDAKQEIYRPLAIGELLQRLEEQTGERYVPASQLGVKLPAPMNVKLGGDAKTKAMFSGMNMMLADCRKAVIEAGGTVEGSE